MSEAVSDLPTKRLAVTRMPWASKTEEMVWHWLLQKQLQLEIIPPAKPTF